MLANACFVSRSTFICQVNLCVIFSFQAHNNRTWQMRLDVLLKMWLFFQHLTPQLQVQLSSQQLRWLPNCNFIILLILYLQTAFTPGRGDGQQMCNPETEFTCKDQRLCVLLWVETDSEGLIKVILGNGFVMASQTAPMCPMKMIVQRKTTVTMSTCSGIGHQTLT